MKIPQTQTARTIKQLAKMDRQIAAIKNEWLSNPAKHRKARPAIFGKESPHEKKLNNDLCGKFLANSRPKSKRKTGPVTVDAKLQELERQIDALGREIDALGRDVNCQY